MSNHFADRLADAVRQKKSVVCVGLDPRAAQLPPVLASAGSPLEATLGFCCKIIDAVADQAAAVKPNIAFFEAFGPAGLEIYARVCAHASRAGVLVIGDVKRGDIGSTAEAYAEGLLPASVPASDAESALCFTHDALTINSYLGSDGVKPFMARASKQGQGLFCLVKTSNPSSAELQNQELKSGGTVAEAMARLVDQWGAGDLGKCGFSSVGAVVGATHGKELSSFRKLMPKTVILLPGYGAQGAKAADVVDAFRADCQGALVNASRSVIFAWEQEKSTDFAGAARRAAIKMREELSAALSAAGKHF